MPKPKLTDTDYQRAALTLNCDVAAIKAVAEVESRDNGFLADGRPVILFERHIFHRLTKGKWTNVRGPNSGLYIYRDISNPAHGGYGAEGGFQHDRLAKAAALDRDAALKSASWGKFQLMGFNYELCGFERLQQFINAMYRGEPSQLDAFVKFLQSKKLDAPLRSHRWSTFALGYNGTAYRRNNYQGKLAAAWKRYSS